MSGKNVDELVARFSVSQDADELKRLFCQIQTAAVDGDPRALIELGHFYRLGVFVYPDLCTALALYSAAARTDPNGMLQKGACLSADFELEVEARVCLESALADGVAEAGYWLAASLYSSGDGFSVRVVDLQKTALENGVGLSYIWEGRRILVEPESTPEARTAAVKHLLHAAVDLGEPIGFEQLAALILNGEHPDDRLGVVDALDYLEQGARLGSADCLGRIGALYLEGLGETLAPDRDRALPVLHTAAMKGDASSRYSLGFLYMLGKGVAPCPKTAAELFELAAAASGDARAQYATSVCYRNGDGVSPDARIANRWFSLALKGGSLAALEAIKDPERNSKLVDRSLAQEPSFRARMAEPLHAGRSISG